MSPASAPDSGSGEGVPFGRRFLARLSRRTTSGRFIPEIDGLRFVAIALVVLYHLEWVFSRAVDAAYQWTWLDRALVAFLRQGFFGVQLFFVISGFVLAYPFAAHALAGERPVRLGPYYLRRLTRLEPPYVFNLTVLLLVLWLVRGGRLGDLLPHYAASVVYSHGILYGASSSINSVAWSLEVEVQFYLLAPLLASVFLVRSRLARRSVLAGVAGANALVHRQLLLSGAVPPFTVVLFLQYFLMGYLLADIYVSDWGQMPRRSGWWDLLTLAIWPVMVAQWLTGRGMTVFFLTAFIAYVAAFRGRFTSRVLSNGWLVTIGGMCYTIYLYHLALLEAAAPATARWRPFGSYGADLAVQAVVLGLFVLLVSALLFVAVERPCMDRVWPRRLWAAIRHAFGREPARA